MRRRLRSVLQKSGLAVGAIVATLACGEVAVRVYERLAPPPLAPPPDPELAGLPALDNIMELAQPNARGVSVGVLWRTNSAGFRGPEVREKPLPGVFRIAVLGDSWAAGQGVREQDTYAVQLERMLDESHSGRVFEVLNFGLGGLNAHLIADRARRLAMRFRPNLYVYGYTLNDIFDGEDRAPSYTEPQAGALHRIGAMRESGYSHLLLLLWMRSIALRSLFAGADGYTSLLVHSYEEPEKLARVQNALAELAIVAQRNHACVHVMVHTDLSALRFGHRFTAAYDTVERLAHEAGFTSTSTYPAFRWRDSAALRLSFWDGHPNAEGHRLFAEALYASLRELPPSCGLPPLPERGDY